MNEYLRIKSGELKLYNLEKEFESKKAVDIRRDFIERETGADLTNLGSYTINIESAVKKNIENMIGCVQIPVGIAGPLLMRGEYAEGEFWIPLSTTEGALIASVNRGSSVITKAGGADVRILKDLMTRAPVFAAKDIVHAAEIVKWIENNFNLLKKTAESTTSHGKLVGYCAYTAGTSVYVRFEFETMESMGMNMATIASEAASKIIENETGAKLIAVSGNLCCDKKPAAVNIIEGRGKTVTAGVFISDEIIESVLKTSSDAILEVNTRKNLVGSARACSLGFNSHAANIIAGIYIASGQDAAHVVEGSTAITTVDKSAGGLYISVTLPSIQVGTVGGGTALPTQKECLSVMGCAGDNSSKKLAEIIACAVLAGELSLLGALAAGHLGKAHKKLGRGE